MPKFLSYLRRAPSEPTPAEPTPPLPSHRRVAAPPITAAEEVRRIRAYDATTNDREAADLLGIRRGAFCLWRHRRGLPAKTPRVASRPPPIPIPVVQHAALSAEAQALPDVTSDYRVELRRENMRLRAALQELRDVFVDAAAEVDRVLANPEDSKEVAQNGEVGIVKGDVPW